MDKNNFSEIYKKYVMTAYSAAMQVVHNEADADDIAQETMVKLYLNIDALDEDRVEGWVRVAAKNLGIDYQTINEQIQNIAQKKDTLCRRMYN